MTDKQIVKVTGAIITSFINLHFLEESKNTGVFKQKAKFNLKRTLNDLLEIENKYFDSIDEVDSNGLGDKLVANKMEFVKWLLNKYDFNEFSKLQEVCLAYDLEPKKVTDITDKILLNNGAKEI